MNEKIKQHLIAVAEKNNWPTDNETLLEILFESEEVYTKKISNSRWWYTEFVVTNVDGMLIGYEYARANRDEHVRDLGWEFDESTICEVEAVQETITVYKKLTPLKGERINTMNILDPKEQQEAAATESASQDTAMEATNEQATEQESAEEGTTEG